MSPADMFAKVLSLKDAEAKASIVVNDLLGSMIRFDVEAFDNMLKKYIALNGIEKTIIQILFPFLDKVGILWLTNHINPAQERLVSNIIRQKVIAGIDSISTKASSATKVCLFLPEGEFHEIGLLFVAFLLKKKGIPVIYLGSHTPLEELKIVTEAKKPDYLYTHVTTAGQSFNFEKFISTLHKEFKNIPTIISGRVTARCVKKIPHMITFKKSIDEVRDFVDSL
jgi:methanogenic corrinoid protein MtbC1